MQVFLFKEKINIISEVLSYARQILSHYSTKKTQHGYSLKIKLL